MQIFETMSSWHSSFACVMKSPSSQENIGIVVKPISLSKFEFETLVDAFAFYNVNNVSNEM